jgi:low affinity Fe/Cu permease
MIDFFNRFAKRMADLVGSPWAFAVAAAVMIAWALTGPFMGFSDTWQLLINTGTTIVTFLIVFLIQNTQNRDAKALHLKIDELLRAVSNARTRLVNIDECTDEELKNLQAEFRRIGEREVTQTKEVSEREISSEGVVREREVTQVTKSEPAAEHPKPGQRSD